MPILSGNQLDTDIGYFQANVTSVVGSRPIKDARVQIRDINSPNQILEEFTTDSNGQSEVVDLSAPPLEFSMTPGAARPYSVYNIHIEADGYEAKDISGAEILPGQTALQNVSLIPLADDTGNTEELYVIPPHTLYGEYPPKIPEDEIKETTQTGEIVLSRVVIPPAVSFFSFENSADGA